MRDSDHRYVDDIYGDEALYQLHWNGPHGLEVIDQVHCDYEVIAELQREYCLAYNTLAIKIVKEGEVGFITF